MQRALLQQHPDPLLVVDPRADRFIEVNHAACERLGYTREVLLSIAPSRLHGEDLPGLIVFTQATLERGHGWTDELSCHTGSGERLAVEYSARTLVADDSTYLVLSFRSLEELQHRRERSNAEDFVRRGLSEWRRVEKLFQDIERENQLILRAAGEGIYGVNASGATTFVNPAAERMLGWTAEEMVGKSMHQLVHHTHADGAPYIERECPILAAFRDGVVHKVDDEVFWRKNGTAFAVEYTSTPIRDNGQLVGAVIVFRDISDRKQAEAQLRNALAEVEQLKQRLELENAYLQEEIRAEHNYREIVGRSNAVRQTIRQIELVAPTDASVLITGESGTGKELIARAIHDSSTRGERAFIRVNCAAIPRDLFESEFFGHAKGAFTGAVKERAGRFELADKGTIFLDEVGELPLELQSKLLRVIQEGQFERVGDERTRSVDVRVIAATNRVLSEEVAAGRFREDLYYRINVFPIESAALRDRPEDIPLLASHFLARACRRFGVDELRLTHADMQRLQGYHWPGNVRELENIIERAVIVSRNGKLRLDVPVSGPARPGSLATGKTSVPTSSLITEQQRRARDREMIIHALDQSGGKVFGPGGAADLLGVKPTTLASRIKRLGIDRLRRA
ncbi:MAG: histidine kinase [Gammaproteobacteria bacterium SG8_47]|nr:MAG: histidine kinase [Gammaproteobacteria bacterium SG8_47]